LDAVLVEEAAIGRSGGLAGDREFAIVDAEGKWVNGKRTPLVHRLRSPQDLVERIRRDARAVEAWLSAELGLPVHLDHDTDSGFPDDLDSPGPTLLSTASLREVASWFGLADLEEARRRFRANLEIDGVPAFWEDSLIGSWFRLGDVRLYANNACARCVVPSRDSLTGELPDPGFQKAFVERRRASLPAWSDPGRFDHFYRLALNTRVPESEAGKRLRVGDVLERLAV
jgi:hypothetical protein